MLLEQDLDELNDSNSFLSMAINSAVKNLEHSEVDTNFFLENGTHIKSNILAFDTRI